MNQRGLKIGGHLDRYVGSLFVSSYATAFMLVVGLFMILDMAANLDQFLEPWPNGGHASTLMIVRYYLLNVPFLFLQVAPFVTLVAALFTVSRLLKHNETVAALGAGVSSTRLLAPVFLGAIACGIGMFGLRELLSFTLANKRDNLKYVLDNKQFDQVYHHLWLRALDGSVVHLVEFRPSASSPPVAEVRGLEATLRSPAAKSNWTHTTAKRAVFVRHGAGQGWLLEGGLREEVGLEQTSTPVEMLAGFDFTPSLALTFYRAREAPLDLSFHETRELARRDPDNVVYQTLMQYHITFPLANLVLLLVGLPILMRQDRGKSSEAMAAGCLLCIFYFASDFVFRNMGLQGSIDPNLAAWLPVLFFGSLGVVLYDSMD